LICLKLLSLLSYDQRVLQAFALIYPLIVLRIQGKEQRQLARIWDNVPEWSEVSNHGRLWQRLHKKKGNKACLLSTKRTTSSSHSMFSCENYQIHHQGLDFNLSIVLICLKLLSLLSYDQRVLQAFALIYPLIVL
jgi:hypothetical protein